MEMVHTSVFTLNREVLQDPTVRFVLNQGGSRSSKTYSLCQLLLIYCYTETDKVVSIVRKSFPTLRATVMRDFFEVMKDMKLYDRRRHNKTENTYLFPTGTLLEFFSVDEEQKVRGRKRHVLWCNEANELWEEDFTQLNLRTEDKLIFDYNPSDLSGFLYDLAERPNARLIKSTYRNNPFLGQDQIDELEHLKLADPDMYRIYNLGERGQTRTHVLRHWTIAEKPAFLTEKAYGLDFGWQHPTALIRVWHDDTGKYFHLEQIVHAKHLPNAELGAIMLKEVGEDDPVACDSARPDLIAELLELGLNVFPADKAVKKGLDTLRAAVVTVDKNSLELIKDLENYKYKQIAGRIVDDVAKIYDDGPDAARYAAQYVKVNGGGLEVSAPSW